MVMSGGVVFLPSLSLPESSPIVPDQRAFAAASGTHLYCQHCRKPGHLIDRCWVLHPELKQQFSRPLQIAQLQSHLGLTSASQSSGPTAAIVVETPIALHDEPIPPRPLPILEPTSSTPTPNGSLSPIASQDPSPRAQAPLPASSPESGMSSPFVSDIPPPRIDREPEREREGIGRWQVDSKPPGAVRVVLRRRQWTRVVEQGAKEVVEGAEAAVRGGRVGGRGVRW
ncbi:hypothetical protein Acr_08g0017450 [Actinidia rufa]|uniref:Uncharacterized protein n=1 Tax=Actinidia rufa TaxID=165716 RepID=A0A7J0F553_9ERIC|nr:hypothetical protein Acr_08g0017450 [Actinidia rufa]